MEQIDPTKPCCAWCYRVTDELKKCSKCSSRLYCSRECQVADWKRTVGGSNGKSIKIGGNHKQWCTKTGERGVDYEIRSAGSKGMGLFLKRDMKAGEKILVERPILVSHQTLRDVDNTHTKSAIMALHGNGADSSFISKMALNCLTLGDGSSPLGEAGLFLNISRVNHDCIGNSQHFYDEADHLEHLVANHDMPAGTEVTFSYVGHTSKEDRSTRLSFRQFECTCRACEDTELSNKIAFMGVLDELIGNLGSNPSQHRRALKAGDALLKTYDELDYSSLSYHRTHYDLFQIAVCKGKTRGKALHHIIKAYEHARLFYGYENNEVVQQYKQLVDDPSSHRNYACID